MNNFEVTANDALSFLAQMVSHIEWCPHGEDNCRVLVDMFVLLSRATDIMIHERENHTASA